MNAILSNLHWQSDWNGEDVGFPEYNVLGLYTSQSLGIDVYLDAETGEVLQVLPHEDDD